MLMAQERAMNEITAIRQADLRQMLYDRRRELQSNVQRRLRHVRTSRPTQVLDECESSDVDVHEDLELALIQMNAETLVRINEALVCLDHGEYGDCFECGSEIATKRLRALPFAVRCTACEEAREQTPGRARLERRHDDASLFPEVLGY
jgi:DnaK suppressor protein